MTSLNLFGQEPYRIVQVDAGFNPYNNFNFSQVGLSYTSSRKSSSWHWLVELNQLSFIRKSAFNITENQFKIAIGAGLGKFGSDKLLDLFSYRYDFSFGYYFHSTPNLPNKIYEAQEHTYTHGNYAQFSFSIIYPVYKNLGIVVRPSANITFELNSTKSYNPYLSKGLQESNSIDLGSNLFLNLGLMYNFSNRNIK